jgi:hypothetical protein
VRAVGAAHAAQRRTDRSGLDALRGPLAAGFLTSAAGSGASVFKMMEVSRHKSVDVLRGYVRHALFKEQGRGVPLTCQMHAVHTDYAQR